MAWTKPYSPAHNQRLDPELYQQTGRITFITIHARLGKALFVTETLNQMIVETLNEEQERLGCLVSTYCLMPDHLHYLVEPSHDGISVLTFTDQFKGKTTNRSWKIGWQGKLWQPRFYDHVVRTDENLSAIVSYILANPVRKGLVASAEEWPWSGYLR